MMDDRVHVAMLQLRIVLDAILGALDHRRDDPGLLAPDHDVVAPSRPDPSADDGVELVLVGHACLVGREAWIRTQLRPAHEPTERLELRLRLAGDEYPPVLPDAILPRAAIRVVWGHRRGSRAIAGREA